MNMKAENLANNDLVRQQGLGLGFCWENNPFVAFGDFDNIVLTICWPKLKIYGVQTMR